MKINQAELKSIKIKPLKSLDTSLRLIIDINVNKDNNINTDKLKDFLFKPLVLEISIDPFFVV